MALAPLLAACDLGNGRVDPAAGPPLHLTATQPADGEGASCDDADAQCGVPRDVVLRVELDRPLLPATGIRQAVALYTRSSTLGGPFLSPSYDLLDRSLSFRMSGWLLPGTLYQLVFSVPESAGDFGLRAFDGAALTHGPVPTHLSFVTSGVPGPAPAPGPEHPQCADIVALFKTSCSGGCCHSGDAPAMGLTLDSAAGLADSAIDRIAHQTDIGNNAGVPQINPLRFGDAMAVIRPGEPFSSYLLYKLLLRAENLEPCAGGDCRWSEFAEAKPCLPLSAEERGRLGDWFVRGDAMPPANIPVTCDDDSRHAPLDCGSLRAIATWIEDGASCN